MAIADCPNACSRPQIADLGLIGAAEPQQTAEVCHQCMGCVHACREGAIAHPGLLPILDPASACAAALLPASASAARSRSGAAAGGSSSAAGSGGTRASASSCRRSLAREGVLAAAACCIDFYLRNAAAGERFGEVLARVGDGALRACVERAPLAQPLPPRAPAPILRGPV